MTDEQVQEAVSYNRERPYTREQLIEIRDFLEANDAHDVPWLVVGHRRIDNEDMARAIANYQRVKGIVADGKLGPHTEAVMVAAGLDIGRPTLEEIADGANAADDLLHPTGRCTCSGEGRCEWCWWREEKEAAVYAALSAACQDCGYSSSDYDYGMNECPRCGYTASPGGYNSERAVEWALYEATAWRLASTSERLHAHVKRKYWHEQEKPRANWCGAFVASALEAGGVDVPPGIRRGAKRLTKWVAKRGQWVYSPQHIRRLGGLAPMDASMMHPGDVLCWSRGRFDWQGHVALLLCVREDHGLEIAEGNTTDPETGERGQLVHRVLGPNEWPRRLKGLWGVARP